MDASDVEKENTAPERTPRKASSAVVPPKGSQEAKQLAVVKLKLGEYEQVSDSFLCLAYRYTEEKTWKPIVDGYTFIHFVFDHGGSKVVHSLRLIEGDIKFTHVLMTTTRTSIKENFVRWQDQATGTFGARFSKKDCAVEFCNKLKSAILDLSPYATIDKQPVRAMSVESAKSLGSNNSGDSDGSKDSLQKIGNGDAKEPSKVRCHTISVQLPSGGTTSCLVSLNVKLRDILKKICDAEGLQLTFHEFQYIVGKDVGIDSSLLVKDLHNLELKIIDRRERRKGNGQKAMPGAQPSTRNEEKVTQLLRSTSAPNDGLYTEINNSQVNDKTVRLDVTDHSWHVFLNAANIHESELSNPTKIDLIEQFVADRGGLRFLALVRDSKLSKQMIEDLHHLAARVAGMASSPTRELPPPPSTKPPDIPAPYDSTTKNAEEGFKMRRAASEDALVSPSPAETTTLPRSKKRQAPRPPPVAAQNLMHSAKSMGDLSGSGSHTSLNDPHDVSMRRQVSEGSGPQTGKRKAPPPPSISRADVTSPTASVLSANSMTTTMSSISPPSSPNFSPRSIDSDMRLDGGYAVVQRPRDDVIVNGGMESPESNKPPPIFVPPPPPDSPPPEEVQSPIGSPDSLGMRSPASSFSKEIREKNGSLSTDDESHPIVHPKPRILNVAAAPSRPRVVETRPVVTASKPADRPEHAADKGSLPDVEDRPKGVLSFIAMALSQAENEDRRNSNSNTPTDSVDGIRPASQSPVADKEKRTPESSSPRMEDRSNVMRPSDHDVKPRDSSPPVKATVDKKPSPTGVPCNATTELNNEALPAPRMDDSPVEESRTPVSIDNVTRRSAADKSESEASEVSSIASEEIKGINFTSSSSSSLSQAEEPSTQPVTSTLPSEPPPAISPPSNVKGDDEEGKRELFKALLSPVASEAKPVSVASETVKTEPAKPEPVKQKPLSALEMANAADRERIAMLYKKMKSKSQPGASKERSPPVQATPVAKPVSATSPPIAPSPVNPSSSTTTTSTAVSTTPAPSAAATEAATTPSVVTAGETIVSSPLAKPEVAPTPPVAPPVPVSVPVHTPPAQVDNPVVSAVPTPPPVATPAPVQQALPVAIAPVPTAATGVAQQPMSAVDLQAQINALVAQMQMMQQSPNLQQQQQQQLLFQQQMMQQQLLQQVMQQQILQQHQQQSPLPASPSLGSATPPVAPSPSPSVSSSSSETQAASVDAVKAPGAPTVVPAKPTHVNGHVSADADQHRVATKSNIAPTPFSAAHRPDLSSAPGNRPVSMYARLQETVAKSSNSSPASTHQTSAPLGSTAATGTAQSTSTQEDAPAMRQRSSQLASGRYIPATAPSSNRSASPSLAILGERSGIYNRAMSVGSKPSVPPPVKSKPKSAGGKLNRPVSVDGSSSYGANFSPLITSAGSMGSVAEEKAPSSPPASQPGEQTHADDQPSESQRLSMAQVKAMFSKPNPTTIQRPMSMVETSRTATPTSPTATSGKAPPPVRTKPKLTTHSSFDSAKVKARDENGNETVTSPRFDAAALIQEVNAEARRKREAEARSVR